MSKLIYHVDDSVVALKLAAHSLQSALPGTELKQFTSGRALFDALYTITDPDQFPWIIFSDIAMPGMTGLEVLSELKRHSKYHSIPLLFLTAEKDESTKNQAIQNGAYAFLNKPTESQQIAEVVKKFESQYIPLSDLIPLDQSFADEMIDLCNEMQKISTNFNAGAVKDLYRLFHTVKGGANSIQFPHLGQFMHTAEAFLNAVRDGNLYTLPQTKELLLATISFVEAQAERIKAGQILDLPTAETVNGLKMVKTNVDAGWKIESTQTATSTSVMPGAQLQTDAEVPSSNSPILSRSASSVRMKNDSLDDLQKRFKRILQLRIKLSAFANQLEGEFFDEPFPKELNKLLAELTDESTSIMDFFISLRVVNASRLKTFCARIITQTADQLSKPASLSFSCDPTLEVDQSVLDCIEGCLTHILRNAIDHGLESTDVRIKGGKEASGTIGVHLKKENKDTLSILVEDDGGGINKDALKAAMVKKGVITAESLAKLPDDQVYDLIFVDGLSTRDQVSEVSGRGVGLGAVKESITQLGGTIKVTSEIGKGSKFHIAVPRIFKL